MLMVQQRRRGSRAALNNVRGPHEGEGGSPELKAETKTKKNVKRTKKCINETEKLQK